jgi:hypothetical protein
MVMVSLAVKARQEPVPRAMQPAARDLIGENPREQAKRERDSPERLRPEVPAWQSAQPALVFSAPVRRQLIPWRDQLGYERCLCSCRSNRRSRAPLSPHREWCLKFPCAFLPGSLRNRFHAARAQSRRARLRRKARKEARSQTTWTTGLAIEQPVEEIRCQAFQFVNFRDSIKRGSRTGKSEVLGTSRR